MKLAMKRRKRGMALIFTLFVVVIAIAIASSYLGMTISSQKAARSNSQEASAISLTQLGLEAMLNAVGQGENWSRISSAVCDVFAPASGSNRIALYINNKNTATGSGASRIPAVSPSASPTNLSMTNRVTLTSTGNFRFWFGDEFLGIGKSNYPSGPNNLIRAYVNETPIDVPYGTEKRKGYIMAVVMPENDPINANFAKNVNGVWMTRDNRNYVIAVTSFILKNNAQSIPVSAWGTPESVVPIIEASRTAKIRISFVFPGCQIQNTVSADYPNTNNSTEGEFSYPNYEEYTANASFIDENAEWDGGLRIDGPSKDTGLGAPKLNHNSSSTTANHNQKISDYRNANSRTRDTSGVLRISTLNQSYTSDSALNAAATRQNNNPNGEHLLPTFSKTVSAQKGVTYVDIKSDDGYGTNSLIINKQANGGTTWQDTVFTAKTNSYIEDTVSNSIDSVWSSGNNSLLSGVDGNGNAKVGLFNKLNQGKAGYIDCYSAYRSDYKPDAMYANESMEVPTIRVTIAPNTNKTADTYTIQKVSYSYNGSSGTWVENLSNIKTISSNDIADTGMLYIAGGNVQVKGRASQSVSIVSDVSPSMEQDNAKSTGIFDSRLNFPNALASGSTTQYKYADPQLSADGTQWTTNTSINTKGAGAMFQQTNPAAEGGWRFPTYNTLDQQPTGNISIIGDIVKAEGTNPSIGLIASNRVLLNDFSHTAGNATKSDAHNKNTAISSTQAASKGNASTDGVLSVEALVASQNHNMCFDFNNLSKNTNYVNSGSARNSDFSNFWNSNGKGSYAPGDTAQLSGNNAYTQSKTNYGMIMNEALARQLGISNSSENLIADDGRGTKTFFYSKYNAMSPGSKMQAWSDAFRGAIRNDNARVGSRYFSNGSLYFNGLMIERFGDINADAGERAADGSRINQLGYKNQFINFDSNLLDTSCPFFTTANQSLNAHSECIRWTVLSYVDKGSPSWL